MIHSNLSVEQRVNVMRAALYAADMNDESVPTSSGYRAYYTYTPNEAAKIQQLFKKAVDGLNPEDRTAVVAGTLQTIKEMKMGPLSDYLVAVGNYIANAWWNDAFEAK
jgi:hypothetical protein